MKSALILTLAAVCHAEDTDNTEEVVVDDVFTVPSTDGAAFVETFQTNPFDGRWVESTADAYKGSEWAWETAKASSGKYVADKVSYNTYNFNIFSHNFLSVSSEPPVLLKRDFL